jgi:MFS family permease
LRLEDSSLLERCAVIGPFSGGVIGAIVGLIIGLTVHWQTAWFAIFEAGIPAGIVGGLLGVIAALVVTAARRTTRNDRPSDSRTPINCERLRGLTRHAPIGRLASVRDAFRLAPVFAQKRWPAASEG